MNIYYLIMRIAILSLPVIGLIAIGRTSLCIARCLKAKRFNLALFSFLGIISLIGVFLIDIVLWFGYGVAHTQKDLWTDLTVLAVTGVPVYAGSYGLWRMALYFESGLEQPPG